MTMDILDDNFVVCTSTNFMSLERAANYMWCADHQVHDYQVP